MAEGLPTEKLDLILCLFLLQVYCMLVVEDIKIDETEWKCCASSSSFQDLGK